MIISIEAEKPDKIQYPFMIKNKTLLHRMDRNIP